MGRKKSIDRESTMKAIEAVVRRQGLAGLSIDAVAKEAGISKSSVLYDFRNKAELLEAFMRDRMEMKRGLVAEAARAREGESSPWLLGMLDSLREAPSEEEVAIAMIIAAGMGSGDGCRALMCCAISDDLVAAGAGPADPRRARLAYLAIHGLMSLDYFGFHRFPPDERELLLTDIAALLEVPAAGTAVPDGQAPDDPAPDGLASGATG